MKFGYRLKIIFVVVASLIGFASLVYSNYIAAELAAKEKNEIRLWAHAIGLQNRMDDRSRIESSVILQITSQSTYIPAIVTDEHLVVHGSQGVDSATLASPEKLRRRLERMSSAERTPIDVVDAYGTQLTVFYDDSLLLKSIYFFPYIQISVIVIFITFAFITFSSSKHNEQNRVWIGLAKETAHQLGTPTSSLLGWLEYLRDQPIDPGVVDDIGRDVARLMTVVDRFSKIGSSTQLEPHNVNEIVASTVDYFATRIPRAVTLTYDRCSSEPQQAMVNIALFEWVLENLLKNALDALAGKGEIEVVLSCKDRQVRIDVTDNGKGMTKGNFRKIFRPGFTTKTRGWGLGLSLSRRIVEQYHHGRIFVLRSEVDKGTTIRIILRRL